MKLNMNRVYFAAGALIVLLVLSTAIQNKRVSLAGDLEISIKPLAGGHLLVSQDDVKKVLYKAFGRDLSDISIVELDADRVEQALEEADFVKDAEVYVNANGNVCASIIQRQPVLRIIDSVNDNYYLDAEGVRFPTSRHYTARVPVATGNIPPYVEDFRVRKAYLLHDVFDLVQRLSQDPFFNSLTEQLFVNKAGEIAMIPKVGQFKIMLGDAQNMDDKLRRLEIFLKQGIPYTGWNKYRSISVQYKGQIVATKR